MIEIEAGGYTPMKKVEVMKHDYKFTLAEFDKQIPESDVVDVEGRQHYIAIRHALCMMEKLQEPSEEMWSGLARAIVMGRDMRCLTRGQMREHLKNSGYVDFSPEIEMELNGDERHMAKGDVCVLVFKAMLEQAEKEIEQ